jgi:hypothetical protein
VNIFSKTIREERQLHVKDLEQAKQLVGGIGARCSRMLARNPLDAHNFAQREMAERIAVQIAVLQNKIQESMNDT